LNVKSGVARIIFLRDVHEFVTDVFFIRRKCKKKIKTNKGKMKKMKRMKEMKKQSAGLNVNNPQ
jgi:hypothetical protein